MPAGTIALTNNSTAVTGSGTSFTTELKANDFIVAIVGGVTYTLGVQSVNSATGVTLITAYNGPAASGVAWTAVPNAALVGITAQVAADVAKAIRGLNLDKVNWQQIFTGTGNVTVNLPDGSSWTGPAWGNALSKTNNLKDVSDVASARSNLGLAYGTTAGTVAQGNDSRLTTVNAKSGGTITSGITVKGGVSTSGGGIFVDGKASDTSGNVTNTIIMDAADANFVGYIQYFLQAGSYHSLRFVQNNTATFTARSNGACYAASFNPTSDSRLKLNKEKIKDALAKVLTLSGYTFDLFGERRAGGLAQEIREVLPEVVTETFIDHELPDGTMVENGLAVDYGATFGLMVEAVKELNGKLVQRDALIDEMLKRLNALDGLDA
ncbi:MULTISPECIES: tail fiber domain-containing protein [unclassified Pantoea]|uniref:tail fiber domain-containing protein n=1 Tax=unclassified Pantoea TaxID=2630326 RepID=UPI0024778D0F|nr:MULTISPECIES: tail fiber domain-containing protein [unclassified Pantoea]GME31085.1 hypothetical protein ACJ3_07430 [Pantoea sp. QMID3]GME31349.1 hypothetical protein ACJ1_07380 [Pantoea sp. QMID1]GME51393.1 hypothetical protein ACJ4_07430 [Pantoea sp. QMID4]GME52602.1 hypothetical protein ACJ2_07420 [Pantoea sp. QMID2]